jgi:hypothetical protein
MTTQTSTLQRWLSLMVRYWAVNMTLIHNRGSNWPGFGYTDDEKKDMRKMAARTPKSEFYWFVAINTVFAITLFGGVVTAGMYCLLAAIGGEQNMPSTPASLFFLSLALEVVACLTLVLPLTMLISSAIVGRIAGVTRPYFPNARPPLTTSTRCGSRSPAWPS